MCARQLPHIQSPERKFSGGETALEEDDAGATPSLPLFLCLHLKHADLDAKLCARQLTQIQSPGLKLPLGPPPGDVPAVSLPPPENVSLPLSLRLLLLPEPPPPDVVLGCLHLKHAPRDAKL